MKKIIKSCVVHSLCTLRIFGSHEGLAQCFTSHMSQFVNMYRISFHYFLQPKVVRGCRFLYVFDNLVTPISPVSNYFWGNHMCSEMWYSMALI